MWRPRVLTAVIALLSWLSLVGYVHAQDGGGTLLGASSEQIAQRAIEYTYLRFRVLSGTPVVLLSRPVLASELPSLGLGSVPYPDNNPPLHLVILRGDFDVRGVLPGWDLPPAQSRVQYVGYVFDLRAGVPTLYLTSYQGGLFKRALNDPSLPDEPVASPRAVPPPGAPPRVREPVLPPPQLPEGSPLPGVVVAPTRLAPVSPIGVPIVPEAGTAWLLLGGLLSLAGLAVWRHR